MDVRTVLVLLAVLLSATVDLVAGVLTDISVFRR